MTDRPTKPGPAIVPHGNAPAEIWLIFPHDGGAPVLWMEPCPFPVDDGTIVRYQAAEDQ